MAALGIEEDERLLWRDPAEDEVTKSFLPLRREVARRAFKPAVAAVRILPSALGTPGVQGAARVFLERQR